MEDLTSIVSATLEARGVLSHIRAQLRANVFAAIHEQQPPDPLAASPVLVRMRADRAGQLALELVHELLACCALEYTSAVLQPEAELKALPERKQLAHELGIKVRGALGADRQDAVRS